jgi:hypothetical protein
MDVYVAISYLPAENEENEIGGVFNNPELARESWRVTASQCMQSDNEITFKKVSNFIEDVYCGDQRVGRITASRVLSTVQHF